MDTESDYVDIKAELQKAVITKLNSDSKQEIIIFCADPVTEGYCFYVTIENTEFLIYICKRNKYKEGDKYYYKARANLVTSRPITEDDKCLDEDSWGKDIHDKFSISLGKFEF